MSSTAPGQYLLEFPFTLVDDYEVRITLAGEQVQGSPIPEIQVVHSPVQAQYSDLILPLGADSITAGQVQEWHIQAKDLYQNVVTGTNEQFSLEVVNGEETISAQVAYSFGLYKAKFSATKALDNWQTRVGLKQRGGLKATYFETTDF